MKRTPMGYTAAVFLALLPFATTTALWHGAVAGKFFLIVGAVDVFALLAAYELWNGRRIPRPSPLLLAALGGALVTFALSALVGWYPAFSFWSDILRLTGVLFLLHVAMLALLLGHFLTEADWSLARRSIAVSAAAFALLTLLGIEGFGLSSRLFWVHLGTNGLSFGNSTFAGAYLLLSFIVTLIELPRTAAAGWKRVLAVSSMLIGLSPILFNIGLIWGKTPVASALFNPLLILGSARASSAVFLALLVFLAGRRLLGRIVPAVLTVRAKQAWSALWLAGGVLAVVLLFVPGSFVRDAYIAASSPARLYVWNAGVEAFRERPLLGWGPENFSAALQFHFDNRLYLHENLSEIWFDRAHNVFVDTLAAVGILGAIALTALIACWTNVIFRAYRRKAVGEAEALLLLLLIPAHLLQMQTAFDTVGTYALLGALLGYGFFLARKPNDLPPQAAKTIAVFLALFSVVSFSYVWMGEFSRERALFTSFFMRDEQAQLAAIRKSLARPSNFEGLRLGSSSLIRGGLAKLSEKNDTETRDVVLARMAIYEEGYLQYLAAAPASYRARMNYAYLLIVMTALGNDRLSDAERIIEESYALSPENPLTYALHSVILLYRGDIAAARAKIEEGAALNPDIGFTKQIREYVIEQGKRFPNLSLLKLENL